jgi:hypothetical protein
MRQYQLLTFPHYVFEQYLCQTCHTLFSGGQDRQEIQGCMYLKHVFTRDLPPAVLALYPRVTVLYAPSRHSC